MNDFGSLFRPYLPAMSSKMRSFPDNQFTGGCHARTVFGKLLVYGSGTILPSLHELMVEVNIIHFTFLQPTLRKQTIA